MSYRKYYNDMKMRKEEKNHIWNLLKWLLLCVLLFAVVIQFWEPFLDGLREMHKISFCKKTGVVGASAAYMLLEGMVIHQMTKSEQNEITMRSSVACAYYCSFFRLLTFGSGSGVAEVYFLSKHGMEAADATGLSFIQYLMQKITIILYGGLSCFLFFHRVEAYIGDYKKYIVLAVVMKVISLIIMLTIVLSQGCFKIVFGFLNWLGGKKQSWKEWIETIKEQLVMLKNGIKQLLQNKGKLVRVMVLNFGKYSCWFLIPFILYGDCTELSLVMSMILMAMATILAGIVPVPSGYGALEFVSILLFQPILGNSRAVSLVLLYRIAATIIPFLVGGLIAWFRRKR